MQKRNSYSTPIKAFILLFLLFEQNITVKSKMGLTGDYKFAQNSQKTKIVDNNNSKSSIETFVFEDTPTELQRDIDSTENSGNWLIVLFYNPKCPVCKH